MNNETPSPPWDLRLFTTLQENLQDNDYHAYCTRKLSRLRHDASVRSKLVHNPRFTSQEGKRHAFASRKDPEVSHPNMLWVLVYQSERCGVQAKELSTASHVRRRLKKAVHHANKLAEVSAAVATPLFQSECQAYLAYWEGQLALSKKEHAQAVSHFARSIQRLQELVVGQKDESPQAMRWKDVWTNWAEATVRPLLRYCQYESNDTTSVAEDTSSAMAQTKQSQGLAVSFLSQEISLQGHADLAVLVLKIQDFDSSAKEDDFVHYLDDLDRAMALVQDTIKEYEALPEGPAVLTKRQDLQALAAYLKVLKLDAQRRHQEQEIDDEKMDAAQKWHAYGNLQSLVQLALDTAAPFGNEDDLLEWHAHWMRLRALKVRWLAEWYATQYPQAALELLPLAAKLQKRALEECQACDIEEFPEMPLELLKCRAYTVPPSCDPTLPLWQRDLSVVGPTTAGQMTLEPTPIPPKHVTCDIAGSLLLDDPDLTALDRALEPPKRKGWFF